MLKRFVVLFSLFTLFFGGLVSKPNMSHAAAGPITLYTPHTGISVTPGESVDYTVDVINNSSSIQNVNLFVGDLGEGWSYDLTDVGRAVHQISVRPGRDESVTLTVDVPLQIKKGDTTFKVVATTDNGARTELPLTVRTTEKGTYKTELTSDQTNMQGANDASFSYRVMLKNRTAKEQHYALTANGPDGWNVDFKVGGKNVTAVTLKSNEEKSITVDVSPAQGVKEGSYKIPIAASTSETSAKLELESVITGTYDVDLTTPDGRLSADVTAGGEKTLTLTVKNTGSSKLEDVDLSATPPSDWDVKFSPKKIDAIEPGQSKEVQVTIKASDNSVAGDYGLTMSAFTPQASDAEDFRMTVKTSMTWGFIGILIILVVIGGVIYLFRTFGRR